MNQLLDEQGVALELIGGATHYVKVVPGIKATTLEGQTLTLPVGFDSATITAYIESGRLGGRKDVSVTRGSGNEVVVKLSPSQTENQESQKFLATLNMKCVLNQDFPNSMYVTGDVLLFRWTFFVAPGFVS